jgi:hypothetical protein
VGAPAAKLFCYAPSSAGQLTIPSSMLLALPAGAGNLTVSTISAAQPVTASGLDVGFAGASAEGGEGGTGAGEITTTFH